MNIYSLEVFTLNNNTFHMREFIEFQKKKNSFKKYDINK